MSAISSVFPFSFVLSVFSLLWVCRNNAQGMSISTQIRPRICRRMRRTTAILSDSSRPFSQNGILRRDLMFFGLSSSLSLVFPTLGKSLESKYACSFLHSSFVLYHIWFLAGTFCSFNVTL